MSDAPPPINAPPTGEGTHFAPRSEAFQRFMAAPLIVATVLMVATATLAFLAWRGGTAEGERLQITLTGTCAEAALPLVQARVDEMGLGTPELTVHGSTLTVVATMPGSGDDESTHVPGVLARQGNLRAGPPGAPLFTHENIEEARIQLDESGLPYTWLDLDANTLKALEAAAEADPEGEMPIQVDHISAPPRPFNKPIVEGGIRLLPGDGVTRARMRVAADHGIVLTHGPLPCALSVGSVSAVATGPNGR